MPQRLIVQLRTSAHAAAQRTHLERGGCFLPWLEPAPEPFAALELVVEAPGGHAESLPSRVVHLAPSVGIALAFDDAPRARERLAPLFDAVASVADDGVAPKVRWEGAEATELDLGDPDASAEAGAGDGAPPVEVSDDSAAATLHARIRTMSSSEKMQLAIHGDRVARLYLLKDPNKVIHTFLLQNPRITLDEVRYLAGFRQANPDALKMISESREWMLSPGVVSALVGNPKTPPTLATKLLDKLPLSEIRRLAKSDSAPRAVQLAARRKLAGPA